MISEVTYSSATLTRIVKTPLTIILTVVLLGACGGSESGNSDDSSPQPNTPSSNTPPPEASETEAPQDPEELQPETTPNPEPEPENCSTLDEATSTNSLSTNEQLERNEFLESANGEYRLYLQGDGNVVLRRISDSTAIWSLGTHGQDATRLRLQGDGNLVLRDSTGTSIFSSRTAGSGATLLILHSDGNLALQTPGGDIVWQTETSDGSATCDDENDTPASGNGTGGSTAESLGRFSSPDAALYALNDDRELGFPRVITSGFQGNGHSVTWDGRVMVRKRTDGWFANVLRPERIRRTNDGAADFSNGAFSPTVLMMANEEAPDLAVNWLAIVIDPAETRENPYPSDASGNYAFNGSHKTYKALVYVTSTLNGDNDQLGFRRATFIVRDANTPDAEIAEARFTSDFQRFRTTGDTDVRCIEPSATIDGRLVVCQGHPDNNGRIDNLVYSWNATPGATSGWSVPKSLANMYWDDKDTLVDGIPFYVRFPLAERPLLDATGNDYNRNELIKGAYPWISRDGSELFWQASRDGMSARRTGTSVAGRWTGWIVRHIDGPINNRRDRSRLFLSSPGAFTTMWSPFKDVTDLAIPYSLRGPVYPIFGSNSNDYSEVDFNDYLDGNFVLYYGMNEQLSRDGTFQVNRTNDTSGNFNNGVLVGAAFPNEHANLDENRGIYGQAIYFDGGDYIDVTRNDGWASLSRGVTVDLWVRKENGTGTLPLFTIENGVELYLANGNTLTGAITDINGTRQVINGPTISNNSWAHVALSFNPATNILRLHLNGVLRADETLDEFAGLRTDGSVRIGPGGGSGLMLLDEVKVSNVPRQDYEIAYYANLGLHRGASETLKAIIPDHLVSLAGKAADIQHFSAAAADLGETLFNDPILSKERTTSCATCHQPARGFTDGLTIARGNEPTDAGERNTPTVMNRLFSTLQGWSGNGGTLQSQALIPIEAEHEMNLPIDQAIARLSSHETYADAFQTIYGEAPSQENLSAALASFQATQFSPRTAYDDFVGGDRSALTQSQYRGLVLFEGKARCSGCHAGVNFTDESFRSTGILNSDDLGRAGITSRDRDFKLFKVPTLRGVSGTAPYMHNGSITTLREVVEFYNSGANNLPVIDTDIKPLELTESEITDLVNLLEVL